MQQRSATDFVGVLMLQTRFPRLLGDIGNPQTFGHRGLPVRHLVVQGALAKQTVVADPTAVGGQWQPFLTAARQLVAQGAGLITTSCGFLYRHQVQLQQELPVPVLSSSLVGLPELGALAGVLTIDLEALRHQALVPPDLAAVGLPAESEFRRGIFDDDPHMNMEQAKTEVVDAAVTLARRHPTVCRIVLECTNMAPFAGDIRAATGLPTLDIMDLVETSWKQR
jgi:hypothetical protein